MKWTLLCLLGCVAFVLAQETEQDHTRCKKYPICNPPCPNLRKTDANGCDLMECVESSCLADPCEGNPCGKYQLCDAVECINHPCTKMEYTCENEPCAMPMCASFCPHGYKKNDRGCDTCFCKDAPDVPPKQVVMPKLCHFKNQLMSALEKELKSKVPNPPSDVKNRMNIFNCNEDGTFKPQQCNHEGACWCVDDRGEEIKGTKMDQARPDCIPHMTNQVDISMVLKHKFQNVHEHMEGIKAAVGKHMSQWLEIRQQFIEIVKITPHKEEIDLIRVEMVVRHDGKSDLAYIAKRFQMTTIKTQHVIECHGIKMIVDPTSITLKHHVQPVRSDDDDDHDDAYMSRCGRIWREHKPVVIVAGFGTAVFLSVVIAIAVMACKKRRTASAQFSHQRMDTYKENLAYQNDIYGHPDLAKEKDVVKALSVTSTDETKPQVLSDKY